MALNIRKLEVTNTELLGRNMKRVTLHGSDLSDFPEHQESGYVKLLFPRTVKDVDRNTNKDYDLRSYTIRAFDSKKLELVLDFLLHGDSGPASKWAASVKKGETIEIAGPGAAILASEEADWYLFAGDMTALPAIAVNLEKLHHQSKGLALIEINSLEDKQELIKPKELEVKWILNPNPLAGCNKLIEALGNVQWQGKKPYAWVAGEFDLMRFARQLIKHEKSLPKEAMYLSCYWKIGTDDLGMKRAKSALILIDSIKNLFRF